MEKLQACTDQACREAALEPAYIADSAGTIGWMIAQNDPVIQTAVIDQLTHRFPQDANAICEALPRQSDARQQCLRRNVRPHLYTNPTGHKEPGVLDASAAPGPRSSSLPVPDSAAAAWESGDVMTLECTTDRELCALQAARKAAHQGRSAAEIGGLCRAGFALTDKPYGECLFKAAEEIGETRQAAGIADAMALCSGSVYGPMCIAHLMTRVGPPVPTADSFSPKDIAAAVVVADALAAATPPEMRELYVDRFWSSWVYTSYSQARTIHGTLIDHLPEAARHHVPVAAAHRQMTLNAPKTMSEEAARLETALALRPDIDQEASHHVAVTRMLRHLWERDLPGESDLTATWVMGPGRRARSSDPAAELKIAVLEAAGQLKTPPEADFFLSVLDEPDHDQLVRWTAARIGAALDGPAAAQRSDDDPLVAARLKNTQRKKPLRKNPEGAPGPAAQPPQPGSSGG